MSNVEDILYEARRLGIYEKVLKRVKNLQIESPHGHLDILYEKALRIEKDVL